MTRGSIPKSARLASMKESIASNIRVPTLTIPMEAVGSAGRPFSDGMRVEAQAATNWGDTARRKRRPVWRVERARDAASEDDKCIGPCERRYAYGPGKGQAFADHSEKN